MGTPEKINNGFLLRQYSPAPEIRCSGAPFMDGRMIATSMAMLHVNIKICGAKNSDSGWRFGDTLW